MPSAGHEEGDPVLLAVPGEVAQEHVVAAVAVEVAARDRVGTQAGALGGKVSGAGGGGFMFFVTEFDRQHAVAEALKNAGAEIVDFGFVKWGMQTWIP